MDNIYQIALTLIPKVGDVASKNSLPIADRQNMI